MKRDNCIQKMHTALKDNDTYRDEGAGLVKSKTAQIAREK